MTMQQATDFVEETRALARIVTPDILSIKTGFKGWSIEQIIRHLHVWTTMVAYAQSDEARFVETLETLHPAFLKGRVWEAEALFMPQTGAALLSDWRDMAEEVGARWAGVDPKQRIPWVGTSMSARSAMTARQMETWAHGQAIYDALGLARVDADRLKNIAVLGINTFDWTYQNRGLTPPDTRPTVILTAPSGAEWRFEGSDDVVRGSGTGFCQTVTQTRNVADTDIVTMGPVAAFWMGNAQCFAGPPHDPPAPGTRGPR
ncbi:uncharacterized protein (TIGR03084 family) [Rubricella aquisinus]|uniref:Uncharacterized protein (TIGR03084 family) n=1 Tax=Rubricella aquisinus TaxID=2028108 RepID=A0A840WMK2_9RHOB|nr:maleylpyruvate isomerase family mycothiol-dependent enzyme [Rubricella aquisinus]MBB5516308.1 uncharacterized protein (TIGR03084 family) [Rubricella aquisinus]